jgi:hypothetical protein
MLERTAAAYPEMRADWRDAVSLPQATIAGAVIRLDRDPDLCQAR